MAGTEGAALLAAAACEVPVEVLSERDYEFRVLASPDGVLVAEQYTQPQWALDAEGDWTEVNPSFEVESDGTIATAAAVSRIEVSSGGTGPFLTATDPSGGSVSLSWQGPLPAPVVDGDRVTYPEVLDGVDLQVTAGIDGFSYALVVKSAAAAASPELASVSVGVQANGLTLGQQPDGSVAATDAAGEVVFSAPAAYMWDSSVPEDPVALSQLEEGSGDPGDVPPGQFAQMPLELSAGTLTVEPDQALLTDPDVEFPVLIDPPFSGRRMHWASVHQQQPSRGWTNDSEWPRDGGMRVGNLQWWPGFPCGDSCGLWRSAIRFNTERLAGKQIISASVKAVQSHTSGCGEYGLQLWHVDAFTSGVSWNGLSSRWNSVLQTRSINSSNRSGGCTGTQPHGVTYDSSAVRSLVQQVADTGSDSVSFGFRSSDEASKSAYRRIAVNSILLEVEYNRPAQVPTNLSTDGQGCSTSSPGPWLTTQRPTLSGKPRDPDGRVGAHLQIRKSGSAATYYAWQSPTNRTHNALVNHRVPNDRRLASGAYRWRMRSLDSHPRGTDSDWREWCHFRVDAISPTAPTVELVSGPPAAGQPVTLRFRSSDTHSGVARFWYGVNEEVKRRNVSSTGNSTVTFNAPSSGGRMWIFVWSEDAAGNDSNVAKFDFFAARFVEATPAAAWRLDGDGLDDSGQGHDLHLGSGVAWSGDAVLPGASSLGFDGTGCVATDGPVVRTDAEYTVAAWVRLDSNTGPHAVMGSAGQIRPGFSLRYSRDEDRWIFVLSDRDATDGTVFATLRSTAPPVLGEWTHLAVRVDPAARHMQMYVNRQPSGEQAIPWAPWHADGPIYVGCSGPVTGLTWGHFAGAIHHVGMWQGLLTPAQIQVAHAGELPAGLTGDWQLRTNGADSSPFARPLTVPSAEWVDDPFGRQRSALRFDGTAWADTGSPLIRTDQSFSVSAWARLDDKADFRTIASQGGVFVTTFNLNYHPAVDRWQLSMSSHDGADLSTVTWSRAQSTTAPAVGQWYHLVGIYDRSANQLRLYVNGRLEGTAIGPATPWQGGGPLLVGTGGNLSGERSNRMIGAVSQLKTWRGALTAAQVADVYGGRAAVRQLSQWSLDGGGSDDIGGNQLTLVGAEGADYQWVEDRICLPFSALGLQVSGRAYARTAGPVLRTDQSYSLTAWVKADAITGQWQTVLAQRGANRAAFYLQVTPSGGLRFSLSQQDNGTAGFAGVETAAGTMQAGVWTYVAAVFDLSSAEARIYVNGEHVGTGAGPATPWHASGPFVIGAGGLEGGVIHQPFRGAIDTVSAWSSTLDPERIAAMGQAGLDGSPCL